MEIVKFDSKISWTVALACSFLNFLVLMPTKVSALFFVEILDRYQVLRNLAGYPAFTITLMRCSGGPFAGYLAERFGINEVMIVGSLLAAIGISACFLAEDIVAVTIFLGFIHGFGPAFTSTFSPQIVKIHFRKHLTMAFGVTQAGSCLGAFCSSPLLLWIFRTYGTSGGFLIIGAIVLNGLPIVLFLNTLSPNKLYKKSGDLIKSEKCPEGHIEMGMTTTVNSSESEYNNLTNNVRDKKERDVKTREENSNSEMRNNLEDKAVAALVFNRPTHGHKTMEPDRTDSVTTELIMCNLLMNETCAEIEKNRIKHKFAECELISNVKPDLTIGETKIEVATDEKINELQYDLKEEPTPLKLMRNNCEEKLLHSKTKYKLKSEINHKDILNYRVEGSKECYPSKDSDSDTPPYTSINNTSDSTHLVDRERTQQQITTENGENILTSFDAVNGKFIVSSEPSNPEINYKEVSKSDKKPAIGPKNAKKSLKIFLDITYWIVIITQSVFVFVLVIFWTTMIDFSRDKNLDRSKEVYLLMTLPVAEIIGRLGLGWITDREYLTTINFSILSFTVIGCSCSLMAWAQGFYVVVASIFMFGVISGGLMTVLPMIIFEFFDSSKQTMGQASRFCLFGPLSFLNGPLIGYFRGTLGSYAWLYHTTGVVSLICAALSALIPLLARTRDEKKKRNKNTLNSL